MQRLEVFDALLGGHQLGRERLGGVVVLGGLGRVPGSGGLVGQGQRLTHIDLQLFDVRQLPVEPHLQLPLIADHLRGLLGQRLVGAAAPPQWPAESALWGRRARRSSS